MPYISKEQVAEIRKDLKKTFPKFKFSITKRNGHKLNIVILSGDIDFELNDHGYQSVNHYYINDHYEGEARHMLSAIVDYATKDQRTLVIDGDYGAVPNFYISISIGRWDRPYQLKK